MSEKEAIALRGVGDDGLPFTGMWDLAVLDLAESVDGHSPDAKCIFACYGDSLKEL